MAPVIFYGYRYTTRKFLGHHTSFPKVSKMFKILPKIGFRHILALALHIFNSSYTFAQKLFELMAKNLKLC